MSDLLRRRLPILVALIFGWLTLLALLFFPGLDELLFSWAGFLAGVALIAGVLNLLLVHLRRVTHNPYSLLLVLAMLVVFLLGLTDGLGLTEGLITGAFIYVQAPLESALASLLAFFLLFIGIRLFRRERSIWSAIFLITAVFLLLSRGPLPAGLREPLASARSVVDNLVVGPGVRGILIGVALGTLTLSFRLLIGLERPYVE